VSVTVYHDLLGLTLTHIEGARMHGDQIIFLADLEQIALRMWHSQACCESVYIADITGDINDLLLSPLTEAELVGHDSNKDDDSFTSWSLYKFGTRKGSVTIRWTGSGSPYYSQQVNFEAIDWSTAHQYFSPGESDGRN